MRLVGYLKEINYDARQHECKGSRNVGLFDIQPPDAAGSLILFY